MDERIIFNDEEKLNLFDDIAKIYFDKNFGETSKADLETLIFSHYIEHCLNNGLKYDDYILSKKLGISYSSYRTYCNLWDHDYKVTYQQCRYLSEYSARYSISTQ